MSYRCLDCSFKRKGVFPNGSCPACGSYNVSRDQDDSLLDTGRSNTRWRLIVLAALSVTLAYLIWDKI